MVLEILEAGFIQRALITGIAVAIICSAVGLFLVLRRHSLFGDALSHMAFGGIAVGLFTNIYPIWTAIIVSVLAALGMTKLRQSTKVPPDAAVAVLLSSGLALGIVLVSISGGFSVDLFSFLFGSILLVSQDEVYMILGLSAGIMTILLLLYRKFMYIAFDEEQAKVSGLQVSKLNYLFIVLASITVIASIRLVGILLISSLIVIPNITAMLFGKGFRKTALISGTTSVFSVVAGILISYVANIATGGTIVLVLVMTFLAALAANK
ncbi:MAG: metal ABC transporter permease [Thermoproteota archaeon]|nr:metal ABC transporter permease [Thermoproteota archaeon]